MEFSSIKTIHISVALFQEIPKNWGFLFSVSVAHGIFESTLLLHGVDPGGPHEAGLVLDGWEFIDSYPYIYHHHIYCRHCCDISKLINSVTSLHIHSSFGIKLGMALFPPPGHAGEDGSHRSQGEGHARSDDQSGESCGGAQQSRPHDLELVVFRLVVWNIFYFPIYWE